MRLAAVLSGLLALVACDDTSEIDASIAADAADTGTPGEVLPDAPEPPAPPLWDCPDGWSEVAVGSTHACEPWPSDRPDCPEGEHRFVSEAACAPLGTACPTDAWADDLPSTGVVFVLAGATGGDGTRALPFGTIVEGVTAAVDGDVVAVGRGMYDEVVTLDRGVELRGACARDTVITTTVATPLAASLLATAEGVTIRDLTVGGNRAAIRADGVTLDVRDVVVSAPTFFGLVSTTGATLRATHVVVRDVIPIDETGAGAVVNEGATLTLTRTTVEDNDNFGVIAFNAGTRLELEDVAVRRTRVNRNTSSFGIGVAVGDGMTGRFSRVVVESCVGACVTIQNGAEIDASDLVVRGVAEAPAAMVTVGALSLPRRGILDATRVLIEDSVVAGLTLGSASTLSVTDLVMQDIFAGTMGAQDGASITAVMGSTVTLERAQLSNGFSAALALDGYSVVTLSDLVIDGVDATPLGTGGRGLSITDGATVEADRVTIHDTRESAIFVAHAESALTIRDVLAEDIDSQLASGRGGRALTVRSGAVADVTRAHFRRTREAGVLAFAEGTRLAMREVVVEDGQPQRCVEDTCPMSAGGSGIAVVDGAHLDLTRFITRRNELAGLQLARGATVMISDGLVAENTVGVNVQAVDFDLSALRDGIVYRDNGVNLDSSELPLPDPVF